MFDGLERMRIVFEERKEKEGDAMFLVLALVGFALVAALSLDGVVFRKPLMILVYFPFRSMPATNGLLFSIAFISLIVVCSR